MEDVRGQVSTIVPIYHLAGRHGSEHKGETYKQQMEQVNQKEEMV